MAKLKNKEEGMNMELDLSAEIAEGIYSNFTIVSHSSSEFVIDSACLLPGMPQGVVKSRVVMNPENAKRLLFALRDNIVSYEKEKGEIILEEMHQPLIGKARGEA